MVNVRVVVWTEPDAPVVLIPAVLAVTSVEPVAATNVPVPEITCVPRAMLALLATANVPAVVTPLRRVPVFVDVPVPMFQFTVLLIVPDCVMFWLVLTALRLITPDPLEDSVIVPAV